MIFSLDVRRARKGDCLLLHFGSKEDPGLIMIDGGPRGVYKPHLRPRIQAIRKARKTPDNKPLLVDMLMISHVDDDHIQGIIELTDEERERVNGQLTRMLNVQSFWHNSFDGIIDNVPEKITASMKSQFGAASVAGDSKLDEKKKDEIADQFAPDEHEMVESGLKVLASIEQGFRLRENARALGYDSNPEVNGGLVMARKGGEVLEIAQKLNFTVAGPMPAELEALRKKHVKWLKDLEKKGKTAFDALSAYVDPSVANLSSIVVHVATADGKSMLLTGDARGDKILEGLVLVGLLGKAKGSKMKVDLLKVPHHGSSNNLETDFFKRVVARHYVFSGDGEHGNPERESLEMLLEARGDGDYEVHLTYPVDELDVEREKDWNKERAKELKKREKKPATKVREKWSRAKHSLAALLDDNPAFAKKVRVIESDDAAHVIDLGDPLGKAFPGLA